MIHRNFQTHSNLKHIQAIHIGCKLSISSDENVSEFYFGNDENHIM